MGRRATEEQRHQLHPKQRKAEEAQRPDEAGGPTLGCKGQMQSDRCEEQPEHEPLATEQSGDAQQREPQIAPEFVWDRPERAVDGQRIGIRDERFRASDQLQSKAPIDKIAEESAGQHDMALGAGQRDDDPRTHDRCDDEARIDSADSFLEEGPDGSRSVPAFGNKESADREEPIDREGAQRQLSVREDHERFIVAAAGAEREAVREEHKHGKKQSEGVKVVGPRIEVRLGHGFSYSAVFTYRFR